MRRRAAAALAAAVLLVGVAACGSGGGGHPASARRPATTTPSTRTTTADTLPVRVARDDWHPPAAAAQPSAAAFCRLLVADYEHVRTNAVATNATVRKEIVEDFVHFTPTVIAAAPSDIAPAAHTYLSAIARLLSDLAQAGFQASRTPPGQVAGILTSPANQAAGKRVTAFAAQDCHFDLTALG